MFSATIMMGHLDVEVQNLGRYYRYFLNGSILVENLSYSKQVGIREKIPVEKHRCRI